MIDLFGPTLIAIRDYPAVAAITPRVRGFELAPGDDAPAVVLSALGNTRQPFGAGSGRVGMQQPRYGANCYAKTSTGATQLAGAVSDAIHARGPRIVGGKVTFLSMDDGWGGVAADPDRPGWVFETVLIEVTGGAYVADGEAVAGDFGAAPMSDMYTHVQSAPLSVWTVVHNLGRYPAVTTVDSSNSEIVGDLDYVSANTLTVAFSGPVSGFAYLT